MCEGIHTAINSYFSLRSQISVTFSCILEYVDKVLFFPRVSSLAGHNRSTPRDSRTGNNLMRSPNQIRWPALHLKRLDFLLLPETPHPLPKAEPRHPSNDCFLLSVSPISLSFLAVMVQNDKVEEPARPVSSQWRSLCVLCEFAHCVA